MNVTNLFNSSLEIGGWLTAATTNITGSMYITVLIFLLLIIGMVALFRIPIVYFLILILPLLIMFGLYDVTGQSMALLTIVIVIIGWLVGKMLFVYR